jgi:hypothetical protein
MSKTDLCLLFEKYGSDKCDQIFHTYSRFYYSIFLPRQNSVKNFLEIGIGTKHLMIPIVGSEYQEGASLKSWRDFFPNATIYGLDIDKSLLFEEDRIKCYYVDQSKESSLIETSQQIFQENLINSFDAIIDDGSHMLEHMICSIKTISQFLIRGGIYIIEDIKDHEIDTLLSNTPDNLKILCVYAGNYGRAKTQDNFIAYQKI